MDPVFVMLPEGHALAGEAELDLAALADECWADVPGDGCFADCFTAACARSGFTPVSVYETDTSSVVHLVQVGRAIGLCRATFPCGARPGDQTAEAGAPLSWRHLVGWHPHSPLRTPRRGRWQERPARPTRRRCRAARATRGGSARTRGSARWPEPGRFRAARRGAAPRAVRSAGLLGSVGRGGGRHPGGELEVLLGDRASRVVRVDGEGHRVVPECQVGVMVQLVLDPRDVDRQRGGGEVGGQPEGPGDPVSFQRPAGQALQ